MRSDKEILDQTEILAIRFYMLMGYIFPKTNLIRNSLHPQEMLCWDMACVAQSILTNTDIDDCYDDETENANNNS